MKRGMDESCFYGTVLVGIAGVPTGAPTCERLMGERGANTSYIHDMTGATIDTRWAAAVGMVVFAISALDIASAESAATMTKDLASCVIADLTLALQGEAQAYTTRMLIRFGHLRTRRWFGKMQVKSH